MCSPTPPLSPVLHRFAALLLPLVLLLPLACSKELNVTRLNSDQKKPNNVWVFFTVEDQSEPVPNLTAEDFDIYEDEQLVSTFESQQVIQNPEVAAVMYTLLLLDMSGSITESGQADLVVDAAQGFVETVGQSQKVAVFAFDGDEDLQSVVRFTEAKASVEGGLEGLRSYKPRDPSTNLHGAIVDGLDVLRKALDKDKRPLKFGTLVVFSDGTDRAARVSREEMLEALGKEEYVEFEVFAIGVGAEMEEERLSEIGRDGTELVEDEAGVRTAFERVAKRIDDQAHRFYLLSYCSPSRSGEHTVRIEAKADRKPNGKPKKRGSVGWTFDAKGFGPPPDCDPQRQPSFKLDSNLTQDRGSDEAEGSKGRRGKASGSAGAGGGKASAKGSVGLGKPSTPGGG